MIKIQLAALKEGRFKKEVVVSIPTDEVSKAGETVYQKAHFIGEFINVSEAEREAHQKQLAELSAKADKLEQDDDASFEEKAEIKREVQALTISFIQKYFVGFDKHPKHAFPFYDGDEPLKSSAEAIAALLDIRLIREQVSDTYNDEINKNQNEKLNKLLAGNLKK